MNAFSRVSIVATALALSLAVGSAAALAAPIRVEVPAHVEAAPSGVTRAEVIADFHMWRLAGLQELTRGDRSVDTSTPEYQHAYPTYVQLRASPQFAALVKQLQQHPQASVVAGQADRAHHAAN